MRRDMGEFAQAVKQDASKIVNSTAEQLNINVRYILFCLYYIKILSKIINSTAEQLNINVRYVLYFMVFLINLCLNLDNSIKYKYEKKFSF